MAATSEVKSSKDWQRIVPGVVISLVSLAVALYFVDLQEFLAALKRADVRYIVLGVVVSLVWLGLRGVFWRTLLQKNASYKDVFLTLNEGYLLNNVLPFRLGEVGRAFLLSRKAPVTFVQVLSTIIIERALDVVFAAGLLLSTLPFVVGAAWAQTAAIAAGGVVLLGLVFLYGLAHNQERALQVFHRLAQRVPLLERLGGRTLESFFKGLSVLTDTRRFLAAIAWVTINWLVAILQYYVFLQAYFPSATLLWAAFTLGAAALGIAAPSSPGAVGVYELTVVAALSLFDPNNSAAFAFAITAHLMSYLISAILGAYALAQDGQSLSGLYHSVRGMLGKERSG